MRDRHPIDLAALCWLGLALLWLGYVVEMAAGQEQTALGARPSRREQLGVPTVPSGPRGEVETAGLLTTLARACVAEASWSAPDHAALLHVLARRARAAAVTIDVMAQRYVSMLRRKPDVRRSWVLQLEPLCAEPAGWPVTAAWSRHRDKCLATFERVEAFLRGELRNPCPRASHWGAKYGPDLRRASKAIAQQRWALVVCEPETSNAFYAEVER